MRSLANRSKPARLLEGLAYYAYAIPRTEESYLTAYFNRQQRAVTLELTGSDYAGTTGFPGLTLGQDATSVKAVLGEPSKTRHEKEDNLDFWDYAPANFSLEFTADRKLFSIQVNEDPSKKPDSVAGSREASEFAHAVRSADVDVMMRMSSGFLVCTHGAAMMYTRAARTDLANRGSRIGVCLSQAAQAIDALGAAMEGTSDELRAVVKGGVFGVTKFPPESPLKEIVFAWEVDAWRVYEVTFR